jgi:hypothetical protein
MQKRLFYAKIWCVKFYFACIISVRSAPYEKREGSGSGSVPLTNESGTGKPKNMRIPKTDFSLLLNWYRCSSTEGIAAKINYFGRLCDVNATGKAGFHKSADFTILHNFSAGVT